jgi:acyl-CoA dehydrogenase
MITGDYSRIRKQFGFPIGLFEGVEEPMARIAGLTYIADAARTATVQMVDRGEKPAIPSAILKYHLTEGMRKAVIDAMDILGGKAVMNGPQNSLALLYRGVPIAITVEGANIMTRNLIIFGQGGVRAHNYLLREMEAASQPDKDKAAQDLAKLLRGHVGSVIANTGRSLFYNVTRGHGSHVPVKDRDVAAFYRHINRISASFNLVSNATLGLLGGDLKRKERISARLGDVLSNMYLASSVLRHYESTGRNKDELAVVRWACRTTLHNAEKAMDDLLRNYPNKVVGGLLRTLVMPFGRLVQPPTDEMDRAAARVLYNGGEARKRLTSGLFIPGDNQKDDPIYRLEDAYAKSVAAEPIEKKMREATKAGTLKADAMAEMIRAAEGAGIITAEEAKQMSEMAKARDLVVNVDDFAPEKPAEKPVPPKPAAA